MENVFIASKSFPKIRIFLALISSIIIIFARIVPFHTVVRISGLYFSYTDFFVIITAGISGLNYAMVSFACIFIASLIFATPDFSGIYSLFVYLAEIYLAVFFAKNNFYKTAAKSFIPFFIFVSLITFLWELTFKIIADTDYSSANAPTLHYIITATPEVFLATLLQYVYFRNAKYTKDDKKHSILASRIALISILEAVILCLVAVSFYSIEHKGKYNFRDIIQLAMMFLSASIPLAYFLTYQIKKFVVYPLDTMTYLMDMTIDSENKSLKDIPALSVKTGDEIEKLFTSLYKMIGDMSNYYERIIDSERKANALTEGFMTALAKAVDEKDHYTAGHSVRVAKYSREIARRMGKSEEEQQRIYYIGLVHDIGKIGVNSGIINKKSQLTDEEYKNIKEHTMKGYFILKNVSEMPSLSIGARWHHERYDGKGYPDGLKGKEIPEIARIIAVADTYDAMTSHRTYSTPKDRNTVRNEIIKERGKQFDPHIANILVTMIDDGSVNFI